MEAFGNFIADLPPLLQLVLGAIGGAAVLYIANRVVEWNEGREKSKK
ncbi:MAG: hypothetical protein KC553_11815 [Nitrospina sp.]|nr:hypothetical protein [Nitrospina sp.]